MIEKKSISLQSYIARATEEYVKQYYNNNLSSYIAHLISKDIPLLIQKELEKQKEKENKSL